MNSLNSSTQSGVLMMSPQSYRSPSHRSSLQFRGGIRPLPKPVRTNQDAIDYLLNNFRIPEGKHTFTQTNTSINTTNLKRKILNGRYMKTDNSIHNNLS